MDLGYDVLGIENDMRATSFGPEASMLRQTNRLLRRFPDAFRLVDIDIRDFASIDRLLADHWRAVELVTHTAAEPSHDWVARDPHTDFGINAHGTFNLLDVRQLRARRSALHALVG